MYLRGELSETIATGASASTPWDKRDGIALKDLPLVVGTVGSDADVTVTVEQSHTGVGDEVHYSEVVSNVPGNATLAAGTVGGYKFEVVAPYVRLKIANDSGGDAVVSGWLYGRN
ncbi:MAG: hypothetical protein C0621_07275 [Desulfuromonas sp.]|nr:MAG: hypothetical protein C0621_07275 [Desulfuromonas sp.]